MPERGRHQTTCKACQRVLARIEALAGVKGVIIGRSYGGRSLGKAEATGTVRVQRPTAGGLKAAMQTSKGIQELFILVEKGHEETVTQAVAKLCSS